MVMEKMKAPANTSIYFRSNFRGFRNLMITKPGIKAAKNRMRM
jgi:hypothetical protein